VKPEITKLKGMRGRITGYRASLGEFFAIQADAATPAQAVEDCERAALDAINRLSVGAKCGSWRGHAWIVMPSLHGWEYRVDGMSSPDTLSHEVRCQSRGEVISQALEHLAQNVWEPSVTDDAEFIKDLPITIQPIVRSWIRFQRRQHGLSEVLAHRLAGGDEPWPEGWEQVA